MRSSFAAVLLSLPLSSHVLQAAETTLEIRLIETKGAVPNEATLRAIVESPGAQLMPVIRKELPQDGVVKVSETTPFRYASEYSDKGEATGFETRNLGPEGEVSLKGVDGGLLEMGFKLGNAWAKAPQIYEVDGVQVVMPVFQSVRTETNLTIKRGEWSFLQVPDGDASVCFAVRVVGTKD